jgi:hypothetical protein
VLDPLGRPLYRSFPYHELLRELARVEDEDGRFHLVAGRGHYLLCDDGDWKRVDIVDTAWRGLDACELATCLRCKEVATRIIEGVRAEADYARQTAGPIARLIAADFDGDHEVVAIEKATLEARTYLWMWTALVIGALLALAGSLGFAALVAGAGCWQRLTWILMRGRFGLVAD